MKSVFLICSKLFNKILFFFILAPVAEAEASDTPGINERVYIMQCHVTVTHIFVVFSESIDCYAEYINSHMIFTTVKFQLIYGKIRVRSLNIKRTIA